MNAGRSDGGRDAETTADAKARLDAMRQEAGGALAGEEIRQRRGLDPAGGSEDPPLDYRLTPVNVLLQLLAAGVFLAVVGFLGWLFWDGVGVLFRQ